MVYISNKENESPPPVEENETILLSVTGYMKIQLSDKAIRWAFCRPGCVKEVSTLYHKRK